MQSDVHPACEQACNAYRCVVVDKRVFVLTDKLSLQRAVIIGDGFYLIEHQFILSIGHYKTIVGQIVEYRNNI